MKRLKVGLALLTLLTIGVGAQDVAEPNLSRSELSFETIVPSSRNRPGGGLWVQWTVRESSTGNILSGPDACVPPYVAELQLHNECHRRSNERDIVRTLYFSPLALNLSSAQRSLLDNGFAVYTLDLGGSVERGVPNYRPTRFYAVSEADAKTMVQAYLDGLDRGILDEMANMKQRLAVYQSSLTEAQAELSPKLEKRKTVTAAFEEAEERLSELDGAKAVKETIREITDLLNKLAIELAGIREKLGMVERFRQGGEVNPQVQIRLDEMYVELMIERSGLEARQATAEALRKDRKALLKLYDDYFRLVDEVKSLERIISKNEDKIASIKEDLAEPPRHLRPPQVYKNRVPIYRVEGSHGPESVQFHLILIKGHLSGAKGYVDTDTFESNLRHAKHLLKLVEMGYLQLEEDLHKELIETIKQVQLRIESHSERP